MVRNANPTLIMTKPGTDQMTHCGLKVVAKLEMVMHSTVPLLMRLLIGYQFFLTGRGKLRNIERTTDFFASLQIPLPGFHAHLVGTLEMTGGVLLILGLATRLISLPLLATLMVAYLTAHQPDAFQSVYDFINAPPFPFLAVTLFLLTFGPGRVSLDRLFELWFAKHRCRVDQLPASHEHSAS